uniref:RNA polymerase n=1 Tax=Rhizophora mucronata TaxID=61149 RepID=A0A2P2JI67_RHIMU
METLTLEEKQQLVEGSPCKVFGIDPVTQQVKVVDPESYTYDDEFIKKAVAMGKPGLVEIRANHIYQCNKSFKVGAQCDRSRKTEAGRSLPFRGYS